MTVVNSRHYVEGARVHDANTAEEVLKHAGPGASNFAWVGLLRPDDAELREVAERFGIHALAISAVGKSHLRSKVEQFGDDLVLVVRAARYIEATETVEFGEVHLFVGAKAVVTVRLAEEPDLAAVRRGLEARPELLARGTRAVLWAVLDGVVNTYDPVVDGLENDIDEIEDQIFTVAVTSEVSRRIYELHREVIGFQRAVNPLVEVLDQVQVAIAADGEDVELLRLFRDLQGHVIRIRDRIENFRSLLDNALAAHATMVTQRQTEVSLAQTVQTKKISAWAAILYLPSMIGAIYGMNFKHIPELSWILGYPFSLGLMVVLSVALYAAFKKRDWI